MKIDTKPIHTLLQDLTPEKVMLHLDRNMPVAVSSRETTTKEGKFTYQIRLNPKRIRTQKQLDSHLRWLGEDIGGE